LKRLAGCIDRGLAAVAPRLQAVQDEVLLVKEIAHTLDPAHGDCASRETQFSALRNQLQTSSDERQRQMAKMMGSFQPGLFAGGDAVELPSDNLDLERWFRNPKGHERRIHGHHHAGVRIVQEGCTLIHALDAHLRNPEPLRAADLLPYRHATLPASQLQALARRKLMRRARSTKQRPLLLAELEARYQNTS
jgi:hypothetical protein